jgi:hypothetical protein
MLSNNFALRAIGHRGRVKIEAGDGESAIFSNRFIEFGQEESFK